MPPQVCILAQMVQITQGEPTWLTAMPWFGWVAIAGITSGCITVVVSLVIKHRERMAMIQLGMHPDTPPPADLETSGKPYTREAIEL